MHLLTLKKAWVWFALALGFIAFLAPLSPVRADCEPDGSTQTCTGDPGPIVNNSNGIHTSIVKELTNDIAGTTLIPLVLQDQGADGSGDGDAGDDAAALEIDFYGGDFGLLPADGQFAILAKSTGGDGKTGESKSSGTGGSGGAGGSAGDVTVDFVSGGITTPPTTPGTDIVLVQSQGGAGAEGGEVSNSTGDAKGGSGGAGGSSGDVSIAVTTGTFDLSNTNNGFKAKSLGGAGGKGGEGKFDGDFPLGSATGGKGGAGGSAGSAMITFGDTDTGSSVSFDMTATGIGIDVSSIGGDGGNAGFAHVSKEGTDANGKSGGAGGASSGAAVIIESGSSLEITSATIAISIESTGGDGGNGSEAKTGGIAEGGDAGDAGDAGDSMLEITGSTLTVETTGGSVSHGIQLSVQGGNGGTGGLGDSTVTTGIIPVIGGNGGDGGSGGTAELTVDDTSSLSATTSGTSSHAILVESLAGDGGNGGEATAATSTDGGRGGDGGSGGTVELTVDDTSSLSATTSGTSSHAIFVESLAGDGGNGGESDAAVKSSIDKGGDGGNGGTGGDVTVEVVNTTLTTTGDQSQGLFVRSYGGAGGDGGKADGDTDGIGGAPGPGGTVEVSFEGNITTGGDEANGILVQSVGGVAGDGAESGGDAGDVTVNLEDGSTITTTGDFSSGIYAQSVGGGGIASIDGFTSPSDAVAGSGGNSGDGGAITITTTAPITVSGDYSAGIFAQSLSGDTSGYTAGTITLDIGGDITAAGTGGRAILVQSEGHDSNGQILITIEEGVTVSTTEEGYETIGIMDGFTNKITNYGTIEKAEGDTVNGYAVITNTDGALLEIDNFGTFTGSVSLDNGHFNIFNNQAGATLNLGLEFDLGTNSATLTNDGTMSPAGSGVISTSTVTGILTQSSTGIYLVDLSMGTSSDDGDADQVTLETTGASFGGAIDVNLIDDNLLASGDSGSVDIAVSDGGTITSSATVADTSTVDYSVSTSTNGDGDEVLTLGYTVDLSGISMSTPVPNNYTTLTVIRPNHLTFANHLDDLVNYAITSLLEGSAEHSLISGLLNSVLTIDTFAELNQLYNALTAEELNLTSFGTTLATLDFHRSMQSCAAYGENGLANFNRQGRCVWGRIQGSTFKQNFNSPDRVGYRQRGFSLATGVQVAQSETLFFGLAVAYDRRDLSNPTFNGETSSFQIGAVMKKVVEDWTISGTLSVGIFDAETTRSITTPMGTFTANGDPDGGFLSFQFRVDKTIVGDGWYLKPIAALTLVQFWQDSFSETTAGGFGVDVQSVSNASVLAQPALELGGELFGPSSRAFVRVGALVYVAGRSTPIDFRFSNLSVNSPLITLHDTPDRTYGELAVGFDFDLGGGKSLSIAAEGALSKNSHSFGGNAKFRFKF